MIMYEILYILFVILFFVNFPVGFYAIYYLLKYHPDNDDPTLNRLVKIVIPLELIFFLDMVIISFMKANGI